jgi:hypothetical protein
MISLYPNIFFYHVQFVSYEPNLVKSFDICSYSMFLCFRPFLVLNARFSLWIVPTFYILVFLLLRNQQHIHLHAHLLGIPIGLRSQIRNTHRGDWYKEMYNSMHRNQGRSKDALQLYIFFAILSRFRFFYFFVKITLF